MRDFEEKQVAKWKSTSSHGRLFRADVPAFPCKTPYNGPWWRRALGDGAVSSEDRWTPEDLMRTLDVTAVLDLTNTDKYYQAPANLEREQVRIEGGERSPNDDEMRRAHEHMERFIEQHGKFAVHCTHGINRTGFILCSFAILRRSATLEEALGAFEACRGSITDAACLERLRDLSSS